ncbi:MAG TPA: deoxyguanosinetriphosphate triphosphohydrolase [Ignavibacteriaceae bacterium]|nr:deoxyguanosinetriphosphate triphosphohydrolase [Ignavibacteriaceae bacterium]
MEWKKLLSTKVLGETAKDFYPDGRSSFQKDFDRIVFCSSFRRLQDKTQVFPLPESDYVHTRLTHSLEVSCVGRSLGNLVGEDLIKRHPELKENYSKFSFGEIVAAACLAHDIGNPPFGHSGEDAISEYFLNGKGKELQEQLDERKWSDLVKFEGNAQGFRIVTKLQNPSIKGGLRLTCASLSAFTKYPKESFIPADLQVKGKEKFYKKFGFFQSEKDLFLEIAEETGLQKKYEDKNVIWCTRHPLSFLMEAADDICYRIMDLEDGYRLSLLSFKDTEELMMPFVGKDSLRSYDDREEKDKIGYLRAKSINGLIKEIASVFLDNEQTILDGNFDKDLISIIPSNNYLETIYALSKEEIYSYVNVVEREAAGFEVLGGLLDAFISAVNEQAEGKLSHRNKNLLKLFPNRFQLAEQDLYSRLLNITDFVSSMTDSFAVSLFRKIKGISLPGR